MPFIPGARRLRLLSMNPFCWDYEGEEEVVEEEVKVMKKYVSRPMESTEAIVPHVYGLASPPRRRVTSFLTSLPSDEGCHHQQEHRE